MIRTSLTLDSRLRGNDNDWEPSRGDRSFERLRRPVIKPPRGGLLIWEIPLGGTAVCKPIALLLGKQVASEALSAIARRPFI